MQKELNIRDFTYDLPPDRIALFPLPERDTSKLLLYKEGKVMHTLFSSVADHLPTNAFLFFNDTKVIPARLHFIKDTGAVIEIFLLSPLTPTPLFAEAMQVKASSTWKCTVGNMKRWNEGTILKKKIDDAVLEAQLIDREEGIVKFTWEATQVFAEILHRSGEIPLPPYLKRKPEPSDAQRYQTVYAHYEGAVAAPTAGLHFTPTVLEGLRKKGIQMDFLTLHVSAGTFQPVKVDNAAEHTMHKEQVLVTRKNLENLLKADTFVVPVGTTAMRTLESLYWFGAKLSTQSDIPFTISQHDPYTYTQPLPSKAEAIARVNQYMIDHRLDVLQGETSIYIMPGYKFRICQGLITNFHQPGSTLILLVAAFVGNDWKKIYEEALSNDYRFLSYGDSSLLIPI